MYESEALIKGLREHIQELERQVNYSSSHCEYWNGMYKKAQDKIKALELALKTVQDDEQKVSAHLNSQCMVMYQKKKALREHLELIRDDIDYLLKED